MSEHVAKVAWDARAHASQPATFSRDHEAVFSPAVSVAVSAAPEYLGNVDHADPEQLLVAALASCHMLYFLAICEGSGYKVQSYRDEAVGVVEKSGEGFHWVSTITLRPRVSFASGKVPDEKALERLHGRAHKGCFIANSIKSRVVVSPVAEGVAA